MASEPKPQAGNAQHGEGGSSSVDRWSPIPLDAVSKPLVTLAETYPDLHDIIQPLLQDPKVSTTILLHKIVDAWTETTTRVYSNLHIAIDESVVLTQEVADLKTQHTLAVHERLQAERDLRAVKETLQEVQTLHASALADNERHQERSNQQAILLDQVRVSAELQLKQLVELQSSLQPSTPMQMVHTVGAVPPLLGSLSGRRLPPRLASRFAAFQGAPSLLSPQATEFISGRPVEPYPDDNSDMNTAALTERVATERVEVKSSPDRRLKLLSHLKQQLPRYDPKVAFDSWSRQTETIIAEYSEECLTAFDLKNLVKGALPQDDEHADQVIKIVADATTFHDVLRQLTVLYQPKHLELNNALEGMSQQLAETPYDFVQRLQATYAQYHCKFPDTADAVQRLLPKFADTYRNSMSLWIEQKKASQLPVTLGVLKDIASMVGPPGSSVQSKTSVQTRSQAARVNASNAVSSSTAGKAKGKINGKQGKGIPGLPERPFVHSRPSSSKASGASLHSALAGRMVLSDDLIADAAAVNAGNARRPRNAEPHVPFEAQQQGYSRPFPAQVSPASRLATSTVSMTLLQLVGLLQDPAFVAAGNSLTDFFGNHDLLDVNTLDSVRSTLLSQISAAVPEIGSSTHGHSGPLLAALTALTLDACPAVVSTATASEPAESAAPLPVKNGAQVPTSEIHVFAGAASGPTVAKSCVKMPEVDIRIGRGNDLAFMRQARLDTGATVSCISESAFRQDKRQLLLTGDLLQLQPLPVRMFDNSTVHCSQLLRGVEIVCGKGVYYVDLLVVPNGTYTYLLASDFMQEYDVQPRFHAQRAGLGVSTWLDPADKAKAPMGYQSVPMRTERVEEHWPLQASA